ncbi:hypothetical protein BD324DRAFT_633299 [Kockovaella imperatae]|uniref:Uncharacterized protein n=1 Tax=Kockovaella imperatae TaxID=4999 RepID=A0A1Y1UBM8_9TREE|nr:hypothetical protein BD324DRAFT_633299 [Kockovaella imperatae]ORX34937.1 hypothetical protein BD324DRAFT_633299 [Kockovaella imperatae]
MPVIKFATSKSFEQLIILHLPPDPSVLRSEIIFETDFNPLVEYSDGFFAAYIAQQLKRKSHKKDFACLIVGLEYGSSFSERGRDPGISRRVEAMFKTEVLANVKPTQKVEDVKIRMDMWKFQSLREYAKELEGLDRHLLPDYVWTLLEKEDEIEGSDSESAVLRSDDELSDF